MTLIEGNKGSTYCVQRIELAEAIMRRLQMLGLTEGTHLTILNKKRNGSIIFKVRGTRFAIGKPIASGIVVGGIDANE